MDSHQTSQLLERAAGGDRQAVDQLLERHRLAVRKLVALRLEPELQARVDPSDVVQEAEIDAFQQFDGYLTRRPMPFELWLRKTAIQRLARIRERHVDAAKRSVQRELPLSIDASDHLCDALVDANLGPSIEAMKRELAERVRAALARLSETDREVLLMRYVEKMSSKNIGYVLELSDSAVRKRHARCLLQMRQFLEDEGMEMPES